MAVRGKLGCNRPQLRRGAPRLNRWGHGLIRLRVAPGADHGGGNLTLRSPFWPAPPLLLVSAGRALFLRSEL